MSVPIKSHIRFFLVMKRLSESIYHETALGHNQPFRILGARTEHILREVTQGFN